MKKIFLLLLFLTLEGCLVLGAPRDDKYSIVKNDDSASVVVNSYPKMKVVNHKIKKSENSFRPDSVLVYFNEVDKMFSLDSIKENDDYIIYYRKFKISDFKWYGGNYSDKIQVNVYRKLEKLEQEFIFYEK